MEKDRSLVDWSENQQQQSKDSKRKNSAKHRRAQQEQKKCLGSAETVIKSYSCAWQKDILIQGRLHLTENWICFYSNILGWETKTNISLKDVTFISKQKTALVFPNAIQVEAGDRKYGFASFVHRDRTYNVMQLIWQNSQMPKPSNGETLRNELSQLISQQKSLSTGTHSKSSSMTGDSSDFDPNSPTQSPSHSVTRPVTISAASVSQVTTASESDWIVDTEEIEQVDGGQYRHEHLELPSSSCSSDDNVSVDSSVGSSHTAFDDPDPITEDEETEESNLMVSNNRRTLQRSPSLVTLKPFMAETLGTPHSQSDMLLGGSPNYLHHWKQTLTVRTLWQTAVTQAKPQHLTQMCSPSRLISVLISLFIILLLLSTVSMLCRLSKMEPALRPYLAWQPWCYLC